MDHQAFAQLMGNYGEFVSAIAVFATLAYLAVQVRETRRTIIRQNERSLTADMVGVSLKMVDSAHLRKSYIKGVAKWQELEDEDAIALHMWLWSVFSSLEHATIDQATGRFESEILNVYGEAAVNILRAPGASDWYENNRSLFTTGLQDYIDVMLPKGERTTFDVFNIPERGET
jgi:heme exporter protein D